MAKIVSIHSFRGGTGKSNTTANLAAHLALRGLRVGVVDTDIQSPGLHVLFGIKGEDLSHSLNDFLWGRAAITDVAREVLPGRTPGAIYLIPSSIRTDEIVQVLREGYDMKLLATAFRQLSEALSLDFLLVDTHPGLNEETLFLLAISSAVVIVLRPDQQDYEGTGVTVEVARSLDVPRLMLVVNKAPRTLPLDALGEQIASTFGCEVGAVLPHSDEMLDFGSRGVFVLEHPEDPVSEALRGVAERLATS